MFEALEVCLEVMLELGGVPALLAGVVGSHLDIGLPRFFLKLTTSVSFENKLTFISCISNYQTNKQDQPFSFQPQSLFRAQASSSPPAPYDA